ncbi:MAG TPA: Ig-like domain-containing protein, partial [Solirubrobacterales bacterium]|nr:Ig-like domain-containing protein [Solirubrobacterales bacterium]
MRSHTPIRPATILAATLLAAALTFAFTALAAPASGATPATCAKLAKRIAAGQATTSAVRAKRRGALRRCIVRYRRSTLQRRPPSAPSDTTAPTVAWQEPSADATVSGKLNESNCTATAGDAAGVDRVVFKVDGTTLNSERVVPYNCIVDTTKLADGTHTLTATAYDATGNSSSASISVKVANTQASKPIPSPEPEPEPTPAPGDVVAPNVSWQEPASTSTVSGKLNESNCTAAASDAVGVERVVFKVDGTTLNTERVVPYNCVFDTTQVADGTHTLSATAYDAAGNSRSTSISVKVANTAAAPAPAPESAPAPSPSSGGLVIGVDGGYGGWSSAETTYRAQLNAAVTRHEWALGQPVNAQDALVLKAAAQVHTRIHALLGGNQLGDATHYREWVVAFIRRYGLGGSFWAEHPELDEA